MHSEMECKHFEVIFSHILFPVSTATIGNSKIYDADLRFLLSVKNPQFSGANYHYLIPYVHLSGLYRIIDKVTVKERKCIYCGAVTTENNK